ncbi:hypothetical protein [Arthrobacter sp.]|uniref:hypothetical protein n=1 Tax=Arthrobacter sp. TaxID=1667 RepID=UPI003A90C62D
MKTEETDLHSLEVRIPADKYFVRFWNVPTTESEGFRSQVVCITEVENVDEVLEWAKAKRNGRTFELFAEGPNHVVYTARGVQTLRSAVRLFGKDPTEGVSVTVRSHLGG